MSYLRRIRNALLGTSGQQGILPSGYKRVEYLESTGTQYIDFGFKGGLDTYGVDCELLGKVGSKYYLLGNFNQVGQCGILTNTDGTNRVVFTAYENSSTRFSQVLGSANTKIHFLNKNRNIIVNGVKIATMPDRTMTLKNSNLVLFGTGYSVHYDGMGKIYSLKIYNDLNFSILIGEYFPCLDNSNRPCMYDTVSKQTLYNQGKGEFIPGPQKFGGGTKLTTLFKRLFRRLRGGCLG